MKRSIHGITILIRRFSDRYKMEIDLKINKNKTNLRNFDTDKKKQSNV